MNIDQLEIENFDKYAHEWWNKRGPYKLIHNLTPLRVKYIKSRMEIKNANILDVGCGGGLLAEELSKLGANVTGLDASKKTISVAKKHALESGLKINYICSSLDEFIKKNKKAFDGIICFELIEHVPNQKKLLETIKKISKKSTKLFLSTINRNIYSFIFAKLIAEYFLKIIPQGTHQYDKFIKPSEINKILNDLGFETEDIVGVKINPLNYSFSFSSITKINYILSATKI